MGKGKKNKRVVPPSATPNTGEKHEVKIEETGSTDHLRPSWRFGRFDTECVDWGLNTMQAHLEKVLDGLKSYEDLTWQEIKQASHDKKGKKKNHFVGLDGLTKEARKRLSKINNDDIAEVFSLRLENLFRIIGIRDGAVLNILWIDPYHKVCKVSH